MKMTKTRYKAYLFLIINAILWGASLPIVKKALDETTAFRFLFYRFFIATLIAIPILLIVSPKIKNRTQTTFKIIVMELLGTTIILSMLYFGLAKTSSIEAGLVSTTGPIFIIIGGIIFYREKQEKNEFLGLIIALVGTLLLIIEPLFMGRSRTLELSFFGNLIIFVQNIIGAFYFLMIKRVYKGISKLYVTANSFIIGIISFFTMSLFEAGSLQTLSEMVVSDISNFWVMFASIYMAIGGSLIALILLMEAQEMIEISESTLFGYLQPLFYIPLGVLWLGEALTTVQVLGLALVLSGVIFASRRVKRTSKPRKSRLKV